MNFEMYHVMNHEIKKLKAQIKDLEDQRDCALDLIKFRADRDSEKIDRVADQIEDLLQGNGASEDHRDVIKFFEEAGLPRETAVLIHEALVPDTRGTHLASELAATRRRVIELKRERWESVTVANGLREVLKHHREALKRLRDAADPYLALQDGAPSADCGLVQPITVAEGNALIEAVLQAVDVLGEGRKEARRE